MAQAQITQSSISSAANSSAASSNQPQYFVDSTKGNIKEVYSFQQKLANGGFGIVYLAEHRESHQKFAIKAIQKKKVKDYTTFINEINILKVLVSLPWPQPQSQSSCCSQFATAEIGPSEHYKAARDLGVERCVLLGAGVSITFCHFAPPRETLFLDPTQT